MNLLNITSSLCQKKVRLAWLIEYSMLDPWIPYYATLKVKTIKIVVPVSNRHLWFWCNDGMGWAMCDKLDQSHAPGGRWKVGEYTETNWLTTLVLTGTSKCKLKKMTQEKFS